MTSGRWNLTMLTGLVAWCVSAARGVVKFAFPCRRKSGTHSSITLSGGDRLLKTEEYSCVQSHLGTMFCAAGLARAAMISAAVWLMGDSAWNPGNEGKAAAKAVEKRGAAHSEADRYRDAAQSPLIRLSLNNRRNPRLLNGPDLPKILGGPR